MVQGERFTRRTVTAEVMMEQLRAKLNGNQWHAAGLALALLVGAGIWVAQPAPAHVRAAKQKIATEAVRCRGICKDGTPCIRRTKHESLACQDHREPVWTDQQGPPVGQSPAEVAERKMRERAAE